MDSQLLQFYLFVYGVVPCLLFLLAWLGLWWEGELGGEQVSDLWPEISIIVIATCLPSTELDLLYLRLLRRPRFLFPSPWNIVADASKVV